MTEREHQSIFEDEAAQKFVDARGSVACYRTWQALDYLRDVLGAVTPLPAWISSALREADYIQRGATVEHISSEGGTK